MVYYSRIARSLSRYMRKLGFRAVVCCLLLLLIFIALFKAYLGDRLPVYTISRKMNKVQICTFESRSDFCELINTDVRIESKSSTVSVISSSPFSWKNPPWHIKPYTRKGDQTAMSKVREWLVKKAKNQRDHIPQCTKMHKSPAILFSLGGYAGNNFHDFTDIVIPLYLTSEHFNREVQFLITNNKPGWITKFKELITKLSKYPVIEIDNEDGHIHCFKTVIVGLKRHHGHKELTIDASSSLHSMKDFRNFLRTVYSLPRTTAIKIGDGDRRKKPRILIITRKRTRSFTNPGEIVELAKQLDFEVVAAEASMNLARFAKIVNSCDVIVGVHGAGLANMVFLPENAILIQIIPVGGFEWLASFDFGQPSEGMNLRYLEYKIKEEESTLVQTEHRRVVPPRKWEKFKTVYLNKQNVTLDVNRFKPTLLKALELLRQ